MPRLGRPDREARGLRLAHVADDDHVRVVPQRAAERRREVLSDIFKTIKATPMALSESLNASPDELVRVAKEFGFEGIVAKRKDSVYESGKRTGAWVKYKVNRGQEFVIGG